MIPLLPPLRGLDENAGDVEGAGYGPRAGRRRAVGVAAVVLSVAAVVLLVALAGVL